MAAEMLRRSHLKIVRSPLSHSRTYRIQGAILLIAESRHISWAEPIQRWDVRLCGRSSGSATTCSHKLCAQAAVQKMATATLPLVDVSDALNLKWF